MKKRPKKHIAIHKITKSKRTRNKLKKEICFTLKMHDFLQQSNQKVDKVSPVKQ